MTGRYIIGFILQLPLYYVVINGLAALTGLSVWWGIPICVVIGLMYDIGKMMMRGD